jgi:hypothetical protein
VQSAVAAEVSMKNPGLEFWDLLPKQKGLARRCENRQRQMMVAATSYDIPNIHLDPAKVQICSLCFVFWNATHALPRRADGFGFKGVPERSELRFRQIRQSSKGTRRAAHWSEVVLGPFAETKGPRPPVREPATANDGSDNLLRHFQHPSLDFSNSLRLTSANIPGRSSDIKSAFGFLLFPLFTLIFFIFKIFTWVLH